jgi:hypothetical protein
MRYWEPNEVIARLKEIRGEPAMNACIASDESEIKTEKDLPEAQGHYDMADIMISIRHTPKLGNSYQILQL